MKKFIAYPVRKSLMARGMQTLFLVVGASIFPCISQSAPSNFEASDALQKLLQIENEALVNSSNLVEFAASNNESIARQALLTMARFGDAGFAENMIAAFDNQNEKIRIVAAFGLGQLVYQLEDKTQNEAVLSKVISTLKSKLSSENSTDVKQKIIESLGNILPSEEIPYLVNLLKEENFSEELKGSAGIALFRFWGRNKQPELVPQEAWSLIVEALKTSTVEAPSLALALSRFRRIDDIAVKESHAESVKQLLSIFTQENTRVFLTRTLGQIKTVQASEFLLQLVLNESEQRKVRIEASRWLGKQELSLELLNVLLDNSKVADSQLAVQSIESLSEFGVAVAQFSPTAVSQLVLLTKSKKQAVQAAAWIALAKINSENFIAEAEVALSQSFSQQTKNVFAAMQFSSNQSLVSKLAKFASQENSKLFALQAISTIPTNLLPLPKEFNWKSFAKREIQSKDFRLVCAASELVSVFGDQSFSRILENALQKQPKNSQFDGRNCLIRALEKKGRKESVAVLKPFIQDPVVQVAEAAVSAVKSLSGEDFSKLATKHTLLSPKTPSLSEVQISLGQKVKFETTQGSFEMKTLTAAPLVAHYFVNLVKKDFYNGIVFHRVVPNFVAQAGDPFGDGWGGSGDIIRDEISMLTHKTGTVGLATSGKDTGSSQFFVNTFDNPGLDGKYTLFAKVVSGMAVVQKLSVGDKILSATLID